MKENTADTTTHTTIFVIEIQGLINSEQLEKVQNKGEHCFISPVVSATLQQNAPPSSAHSVTLLGMNFGSSNLSPTIMIGSTSLILRPRSTITGT